MTTIEFRGSRLVVLLGLALALGAIDSSALPVNLSSGAPGSVLPGQSFNETRGLDVTVLSPADLAVSSMKLSGLNIGGATSVLVGARIYDSGTQVLVASGNATVTVGGSVTIPVAAYLQTGGNYRVAFFVETTPPNQGSGTFISNFGGFPYTEPTGLFRINSAHAFPADVFPSNVNFGVPQITLQARPVSFCLSTNAPGSLTPGQSFNETRGLDVTVMSGTDLAVSSMKLSGLNIGGATSALVGARIYNSVTQALVGSGNTTVTAGGPVAVPISATLQAAGNYRVAFFVETTPPFQATGTFVNSSGGFPYTESSGLFTVNSARSTAGDAFPSNANIFVPQICMHARPSTFSLSADAPGSLISGQSFNETRGIDVTVHPGPDLEIASMKLVGLNLGGAESALVGARIYDAVTQSLLGSGDTNVSAGGSVTVPVAATLLAGGTYRVAFFVGTTPAALASGTFVSNSGGFPYSESTGLFTVNSAHQSPVDAFPSNVNSFVPQISLLLAPKAEVAATLENEQLVMNWPSIVGDQFTIEESTSLTVFNPMPNQPVITATDSNTRVSLPREGEARFFRVRRH